MSRGSYNYIMTAHTKSAGDMLEIENIRKAIKVINKTNKMAEKRHNNNPMIDDIVSLPRYRVDLKTRGPRVKNALADGRHRRAYNYYLPMRHAEKVDVYVYERKQW